MLDAGDLTHTVQLERYGGDADGAAEYATAVALPCYLETRTVLLDPQLADELGVQTGLEGTMWANATDLPPGSRLTVRGQVGYLGAATRYDDGGLDHVEVEVTPRPPLAAQRTAVVSLTHAVEPQWSSEARRVVTADVDPYATGVLAHITADRTRATLQQVAEEALTETPYVISLHREYSPIQGDYVRIDVCPGDPSLVGQMLRVEHVIRGTQRLERVLLCHLIES